MKSPDKGMELPSGTVVQLNPETTRNKAFAGCFMVVEHSQAWGCQGYLPAPGHREAGLAYYRATWEEMEPIGVAVWVTD